LECPHERKDKLQNLLNMKWEGKRFKYGKEMRIFQKF
jgi:hypothetical protein